MKHLIPEEQRARIVSSVIISAASIGMLAVLVYFQQIWSAFSAVISVTTPFFVGAALAFLQLPIVRKVELFFSKTIMRRKVRKRLSRALATTLSLLTILAFVTVFLVILLPQIITSIQSVIGYITQFIRSNVSTLSSLMVKLDFLAVEGEEIVIAWENILAQASNYITVVLDNVMAISSGIYQTIFQLFIGLITSFYLLMDKERFCAQSKKICYALMKKETCESLIFWTRRASSIFSGFIAGKILDSLIIGVICYIVMLICRMEYSLLISVIVGITNVIPFFGPFIGAIPSILILLIVNPYNALGFAVFILVLQQLDGNVIGPLILGDYVGISPLWIMISIVIGGGLFGFTGMLLSVPVFALIFAIFRAMIETKLKRRNLPIHSSSYVEAPDNLKEK